MIGYILAATTGDVTKAGKAIGLALGVGLGADLLERALRLGSDLAARLLEAALPLGLGLLAHALLHRLARLARLRDDALRVAPRLADQRTMLLEQLPRLVARVVRLLDRPANLLAAFVEHLLDRSEGVALEHPQRDQERDDRPDHQTRSDRDEWIRGERHLTSTYARIDPSRP